MGEGLWGLVEGVCAVDDGTEVTRRSVGLDELLAVLDESFGLRLPAGTRIELPN